MSGHETGLPTTAQALFDLYPEVSVLRSRTGSLEALRREVGRTVLSLLMMVGRSPTGESGGGLRVVGNEDEAGKDPTVIIIPADESGLAHALVDRQGSVEPESVLDLARQAIELLTAYVQLSPKEREVWARIPTANERVYDFERPPSDTQAVLSAAGVSWSGSGHIDLDVLSAAQRVFL